MSSRRAFAFFAFALFIFGVKLFLIHHYGNRTPYWDQWDYEADYLYRPYLEGTLNWSDLFANLNEHRVVMTRLLGLAEVKANGIWNPLLQMVVNAGLHILALVFLIWTLIKSAGRRSFYPLLCFAVFIFALPYAWENTLAGIQSMFYFVLFFSVASLWLMVTSTPLGAQWWLGALAAVIAFFSLASGAFVPIAAASVSATVFILQARRDWRQLTAVLILLGLFALEIAYTPTIPGHSVLKAHTVFELWAAVKQVLSWPDGAGWLPMLIRNLPAICFAAFLIKESPDPRDSRWFLLGLIIWMAGTSFALAYGRSAGSTAPRYLDLIAIFILLNFTCLLSILEQTTSLRRPFIVKTSLAWTAAVVISFFVNVVPKLPEQLSTKKFTGDMQEANVKSYLTTGDPNYLKGKEFLHIPYPDADRLISVLKNPKVRSILPPELHPADSNLQVGRFDGWVDLILKLYWLSIAIGMALACFLVGFSIRANNRKKTSL